ncbi:MAG: glycosyltransferase family 2 protein [Sphingobacteriaceae bacterium]|nr:glycosyltransferase family 2 protein [Sphingobacteriaceae bacterium]
MSNQNGLVRLIVVMFHNPHDLPPLLASVERHMQVACEVVVWDNGGCAAEIHKLQELYAARLPIYLGGNGQNLGFGKAVNLAATMPTAHVPSSLLLLNPDAVLANDFTSAHLNELQLHNALTGFQVFDDAAMQKRQASARRFPNIMTAVAGREGVLTKLWPQNPFSKAYLQDDLPTTGWQQVDWVSGSALWVSIDRWRELGGYDERYFLYVEDVDLGREAQRKGVPVYFYPEIKVVHYIGGTRKGSINKIAEWHHHMGMLAYFLKWNGLFGWLLSPVVAPLILLRYALRTLRS